MRHLLNHQNIDVNYANQHSITPLMEASRIGFAGGVKHLLANPKIDVNKDTWDGKTALFIACEEENSEVVKLLLRCPATDIFLRAESFKSALDIVKEKNSNTGTSIHVMFDTRSRLLANGHTCCSHQMRKGLQIASRDGDENIVNMLVGCPGIDVNNGYQSGITPLYIAARENHASVIRIFLGIPHLDVNKIVGGETALLIGAEKGYLEVISLLLQHPLIDTNIDKRGNQGSALFLASKNGFTEIVRLLLLQPQTHVNTPHGPQGRSAIITAAIHDNLEVIQLLLKCPKTNVKQEDVFGHSAADFAKPDIVNKIENRDKLLAEEHTCCLNENAEFLRAAMGDDGKAINGLAQCPSTNVNHQDSKGRTALYIASWMNHINAVKELLVLKSIDVNKGRNLDKKSPFSVAAERGYFQIVILILHHKNIDVNIGWFQNNWASPTFEQATIANKSTSLSNVGLTSKELLTVFQRGNFFHKNVKMQI